MNSTNRRVLLPRLVSCACIALIASLLPSVAAEPKPFSLHAELAYSYLPYVLLTDSAALPPLFHAGVSGKAGLEAWLGDRWGMRLDMSVFRVNPSSMTSSGELYRGWHGYSASVSAGFGFNVMDAKAEVLAGAGLTAARYLNTNLVFAYPSAIARFFLAWRMAEGEYLSVAIPAELMLRDGTTSISLGLEAGIGIRTGSTRTGR